MYCAWQRATVRMTRVSFSVQLNNWERVDPSALNYMRPPPPPNTHTHTHTHFLSPHVSVTYRTWWCVEWLQWDNKSIASVYQVRVRRSPARSCLIKDCAAGRGGFLSKCLQSRTLSAIPRLVSAAYLNRCIVCVPGWIWRGDILGKWNNVARALARWPFSFGRTITDISQQRSHVLKIEQKRGEKMAALLQPLQLVVSIFSHTFFLGGGGGS